MQSHSKCLVRHILLGQNIVSSARAWAYKNPIANGELQQGETSSHVHPVKPRIAAGTCRHGVNWFSSRTPCCREAWEHKKRGDCFSPHLLHHNISLNQVQCGLLWLKHRELTVSPWFRCFGHSHTLWHCCRFHPKEMPNWIHHRTFLLMLVPKFTAVLSRANPLVWTHLGQLPPAPPKWWLGAPGHLESKQHMLWWQSQASPSSCRF